MGKKKPNGPIWGLEFGGNAPILGLDGQYYEKLA